jgi:hypothetical protein
MVFRVESGQLESTQSRVAEWCDEWVKLNRHWKFKHPESRDGVLDFLRDFAGPPKCVTLEPDLISLHFEVQPESNQAWKDWLGFRLIKELRQAFPEITALEAVRDCPHAH